MMFWSRGAHRRRPARKRRYCGCPRWAGLYTCEAGGYVLELGCGPAPTFSIALLRVEPDHGDSIAATVEQASRLFAMGAVDRLSGQVVLSGALHQRLLVTKRGSAHFHVLLPRGGRYALFTQHLPREFNLTLTGPELIDERYFAPGDRVRAGQWA